MEALCGLRACGGAAAVTLWQEQSCHMETQQCKQPTVLRKDNDLVFFMRSNKILKLLLLAVQ